MTFEFATKEYEKMLKRIGPESNVVELSSSELWAIATGFSALSIFKSENENNEEELKKLDEYLRKMGGKLTCQK